MKLLLGAILAFSFIACTFAQTAAEWEAFKATHKKSYNSTEDARRKGIWEANYKKITAHNANADKGAVKYRLASNQLLDRTPAEYKALLGAKAPKTVGNNPFLRQLLNTTTTKATTTTKPTTTTTKATTTTTKATTTTTKPTTTTTKATTTTKPTTTTTKPTTTTTKPTTTTTKATTTTTKATTTTTKPLSAGVDLRSSSCTAPIKDQGQCGSCWAFSATYETEYYNCKKKGSLTLLSEQNLVDCDTADGGCNGGWYDSAWQYVINAAGQCASTSYGYTAVDGTCKRTSCAAAGTLTSFKYVATDAASIMQVLDTIGPVSVAIDAGLDSFGYYSSGVYDDAACTTTINHAVNIVGYGTAADGTPYWIVRNSWGTSWGMNGYAYIRRGVNRCGIESYAEYPVA